MIQLSKQDIAMRLRDYAKIRSLMCTYNSLSIDDCFLNTLQVLDNTREKSEVKDNYLNREYYLSIVRIASFFNLFKYFSIIKDKELEKFVLEKDLVFDKDSIFVQNNDSNNFSKKQVIKNLRDAFNHNDSDDKNFYSISPNGKYIEVNFTPVNSSDSFHVKMSYNQLGDICENLVKAAKGLIIQSWPNIDDISFSRALTYQLRDKSTVLYYFKKKLSAEKQVIIHDAINKGLDEETGIKLVSEDVNIKKEHILYPEQIGRIHEMFNAYYSSKKNDDSINYYILQFLLKRVEPLPLNKIQDLRLEALINNYYMIEPSVSYSFIYNQLMGIASEKNYRDSNPLYKEIDEERLKKLGLIYGENLRSRLDLSMMMMDTDSRIMYPLMLYYGYMIDTIISDDILCFGNKEYSRNRIRNSIVHGRYFLGQSGNFYFYDRPNGFAKDNDINFTAVINIKDLDKGIEKYYENIINKNNNSSISIKK